MMQIMQQKQNSNSRVQEHEVEQFQISQTISGIFRPNRFWTPYWYHVWSSGPSADFALLDQFFLANIGLKMSYWKYDGNMNLSHASISS